MVKLKKKCLILFKKKSPLYFDSTDMVYQIYILLKFTVPKSCNYYWNKVILLQTYVTLAYFSYPVEDLWFTSSKRLKNYMVFKYFRVERRTWWRLFLKRVVRTNLLWASPDEGYSWNAPCALICFERHLMKVIPETRRAH
jgi:hypothetical protein